MKQVELAGVGLDPSSGTTVVLLRELDDPHRVLPITIGQLEATSIALALGGVVPSRPLTHDLMAALVDTLDGHLDAVEVTDLSGGAFLANLAIHGPTGERRVDTRPSDAIALALRLGAPVFVADAVLDEAGALVDLDSETDVEETIDEFRSFLDSVDPGDFSAPVALQDEPPALEQAPETGDTHVDETDSDADATVDESDATVDEPEAGPDEPE